jgi:large subunit ribosomal protein L23
VDIFQVIKEPHVTEKSGLLKEGVNQISFKVHKWANKAEVKQAVETLFKKKVLDVKTMNMQGKGRRMGRSFGKKPDWKKAIVKLAPGENIEIFEGM